MRVTIIIIINLIQIFIILNSNKKNLIIGAIENYNWDKIKPFFISLYKAKFRNYDCVMIVNNICQNTLDKLRALRVITYILPNQYKGMKINNVRYKLYEKYLKDKLDKYNLVLHVDVRDTYFQKNFFEIYENRGSFIGFALEDKNITEKINAKWIKYQYNKDIYEAIKNNRTICSGTIWGTVDKFYELTKNIWSEIVSKSPYDRSIHDQAATNYLIYYKKMFADCILTTDNYEGIILSLNFAENISLTYDLEDNILDYNGKKVVAVVHQYDRLPKLAKKVKLKFNDINDYKFNLKTIQESIYHNQIKIEKMASSNIKLKKFFSIHFVIIYLLVFIILIKIKKILIK